MQNFDPRVHYGTNPWTYEGKCTVYVPSAMGMGYCKILVRAGTLSVSRVRYAQYASAVKVTFKPKGKRRLRGVIADYNPRIIVLAGHDNPEPESFLGPATQGEGVTVRHSRRMSCDPGWDTEMNQRLEGTTPILDLRGYNAHDPAIPVVSDSVEQAILEVKTFLGSGAASFLHMVGEISTPAADLAQALEAMKLRDEVMYSSRQYALTTKGRA